MACLQRMAADCAAALMACKTSPPCMQDVIHLLLAQIRRITEAQCSNDVMIQFGNLQNAVLQCCLLQEHQYLEPSP